MRAAVRTGRPVVLAVGLAVAGCATPPAACDRSCLSQDVQRRTGYAVETPTTVDQFTVPSGVQLGMPLSEEQVVLLALWNNAAFQELLVELQLTKADLVQAGLLPNPEFWYAFAATDKPFRYLVDFPVEALWLRPIKLKAAAAENERACSRLTQAALDLLRDTRQAYADVLFARDKLKVAGQAVALRGRIAELAEARLKAGDANVQEITPARVDALQSKVDETRAAFDVALAEERLRNLL